MGETGGEKTMETKMDDGNNQKDKKSKTKRLKDKRQREKDYRGEDRSIRERRQEERRQWKPKWTTAPTSIIRLNEESCVSSDGFLGERILLPQMGRYL